VSLRLLINRKIWKNNSRIFCHNKSVKLISSLGGNHYGKQCKQHEQCKQREQKLQQFFQQKFFRFQELYFQEHEEFQQE